MYRALVGEFLFWARAALLACVGGLAFLMHECLRWFPALVPGGLQIPTIASLCNTCQDALPRRCGSGVREVPAKLVCYY